jgi:oligoribonuclease
MEMTGLTPETSTILEIATIVTDAQLEIIAEGPNLVIHQPEQILSAMDEWNTTQHSRSGLLQAVRDSTISLQEAEAQTLSFIQQYTLPKLSPLCGNSIHHDRLFLWLYMPRIIEHLSYRIVDVSSIKELAKRWYPDQLTLPPKPDNHRALDDIRASINEMRFYRQHIFVTDIAIR